MLWLRTLKLDELKDLQSRYVMHYAMPRTRSSAIKVRRLRGHSGVDREEPVASRGKALSS